jgi:hypothetical protein
LNQHNPVELSLYQQKISALESEILLLRKTATQITPLNQSSGSSSSKYSGSGGNSHNKRAVSVSTAAIALQPLHAGSKLTRYDRKRKEIPSIEEMFSFGTG